MPEETFEHQDPIYETETEQMHLWELDLDYRALSYIKEIVEKKRKDHPAFGKAIKKEYQGKWIVAENSKKIKVYDSLDKIRNDYKGREAETFIYQIGTKNIGPLSYIILQLESKQLALTVQLDELEAESLEEKVKEPVGAV